MSKTLFISRNRNDYQGFFDHEWARGFLRKIDDSPIYSAGMDLCAAWKGTSNARRFPWLLPDLVTNGIKGAINAREPMPLQVILAMADKIAACGAIAGIKLGHHQRHALAAELRDLEQKLSDEMDAELERQGGVIQANEVWSDFVDNSEFRISLWMLEINMYGSLYFAYEDFLVRITKDVLKLNSLRVTTESA